MPYVSVIIPTYNRKEMLSETLDSLAQQTFPFDGFEVIVVDDGSIDGVEEIAELHVPYQLRYLRQENQGDAAARNTGAMASRAEILVSLDDDMIPEGDYLEHLVNAVEGGATIIAAGASHVWLNETNPLLDHTRFQRLSPERLINQELPFPKLCMNSMAVRRQDFFALGAMQDLGFPGSSLWSDVDFAYRAYLHGYQFILAGEAVIWHRDYVHRDLDTFKKRAGLMAYRAVRLFAKYPGLIDYLPMFDDKRPVDWKNDPSRLITRKLVRRCSSTRLVLWGLERLYYFSIRASQKPHLSGTLRRWIGGGNIANGYRQGLRDFKDEKTL